MGGYFSSNKPPTGLDAAGKTTMLEKLKVDVIDSSPVVGFNVDTAKFDNLDIISWTCGGGMKIGPLKRHYHDETAGVIFVMDMTDRERLDEALEELRKELMYVENEHRKQVVRVPLLIFANKMDLPNAMPRAQLTEHLESESIVHNRTYHVQSCCALDRTGVYEGMDWLGEQLAAPNKGYYPTTIECDLK